MRVLVTGAGGFIGSHVARHLVARGDEVTAVLQRGRGTSRITDIGPRLSIMHADLSTDDIDSLVVEAAPDACIHLAWYVEPGSYLTAVAENLASLAAGARLLSALDKSGCPRVVMAGTCLEPSVRIGIKTQPALTIYAAAKSALHQVAMHLDNTAAACAHVFYLYGPSEDSRRVVPSVIRACLEGRRIDVSSGEQRRDFLHVEDVASAIVSIMTSDLRGEVDVCSGTSRPLRDVFQTIGAATGQPELIAIGARPSLSDEPLDIVGNSATLTTIGWRRHWTLETGIARTVDWWRLRLREEGERNSEVPR